MSMIIHVAPRRSDICILNELAIRMRENVGGMSLWARHVCRWIMWREGRRPARLYEFRSRIVAEGKVVPKQSHNKHGTGTSARNPEPKGTLEKL